MKVPNSSPRERIVPGQSLPEFYWRHVEAYKFAARYVGGRRVLDLACGTGYGTDLLRDPGAERVVGIDLSSEAARHARREHNGDRVDFVVGDGHALPFSTSSFDVCVSVGTWAHIRAARTFATEIKRVLAPNGILILCTVNRLVTNPRKPANARPPNPHHVREYTFQEVRRTLSGLFTVDTYYGQTFHSVAGLLTWSNLPGLLARHPALPFTLLPESGRYLRSLIHRSPESRASASNSPEVSRFDGRHLVDKEPEYMLLTCRPAKTRGAEGPNPSAPPGSGRSKVRPPPGLIE